MTFRAKPVVKRDHKPAWETQDRRNFYLNLGFGLIVVLAVLILAIAAVAVLVQRPPRAGRQRRRPVDHQGRVHRPLPDRELAPRRGGGQGPDLGPRRPPDRGPGHLAAVEHRPAARVAPDDHARAAHRHQAPGEAGGPGGRHRDARGHRCPARLRGDDPRIAPPVGDRGRARDAISAPSARSAAQKDAAKAKAEAALKDIAGRQELGGRRPDRLDRCVDRTAGRRPRLAAGQRHATGRGLAQGRLRRRASTRRPPSSRASDGVFRIGRATEIVASSVDPAYQAKFENKGIQLARYRDVLQGDVIHEKLQAKIVADVTGAGPQRRVSQIYLGEAAPDLGEDAVKVRHILYAPNGDPENAANVPDGDPAWAAAQSQATATYARLKADPNLFDAIARKESQEAQAQGPSGSGGKLPYFDSGSSVDEAFLAAILAPGSQGRRHPAAGQVGLRLARHPGHVPPDRRRAPRRRSRRPPTAARTSRVLARDNSEAPIVGHRRRPRLDRQGPARRPADQRHLRHPDRQDLGHRDRPRRRDRTCSRSPARRPGRPRAGSSRN